LQKQIRRKLNGFVVFDSVGSGPRPTADPPSFRPPTDQGENEKRDGINVKVKEKVGEKKINFILSISVAVLLHVQLSLYGCDFVYVCV